MPKTKVAVPVRFEGFADPEARFFRALAKHESREWFGLHREEYEEGWLQPMQGLLAEVRERLAPLYAREELAAPKLPQSQGPETASFALGIGHDAQHCDALVRRGPYPVVTGQ